MKDHIPCVTDVFGHSYQVYAQGRACLSDFSSKKLKGFSDIESAKSFLQSQLRVSSFFWRQLVLDAHLIFNSYSGRLDIEKLSYLVLRGKVAFYELPSFQHAAVTHNGAGVGYKFLAGPEKIRTTSKCIEFTDEQEIRSLLNTVVADQKYWHRVLSDTGTLNSIKSNDYIDLIVDFLKTKRFRVYQFPYSPPIAGPEVILDDVYSKEIPLAPSTASPPTSKKNTSDNPQSLDDVTQLLAQRREEIKASGYQQKYSDRELKAIASKGDVNDRFLVRLIFGSAEKAENSTLGFKRDSGRAPYWATTLDMAESADTDPEILAGLFGIENFDPNQEFCLAVIDMQNMPVQAERESFIPTFDKMSEFGQREFGDEEGFEENTMSEIMNENFSQEYSGFIGGFTKTRQNLFDSKLIKKHAQKTSVEAKKQKLISARHKTQLEFGANPLFSGNGLTKVTPSSRYSEEIGQQYGVVETFTFERDPITIEQLQEQGAVKILPAIPIKG